MTKSTFSVGVKDQSDSKGDRVKLGAEKETPEEQRRRFIEAAKAAGASEDEAEFDRTLGRLAKPAQKGPATA